MNAIAQYTATGALAAGSSIHAVVLTAAAATSTAVVRSGGGSGTVLLTLSALANTSVVFDSPFVCGNNAHLTITGASALVSVVYI